MNEEYKTNEIRRQREEIYITYQYMLRIFGEGEVSPEFILEMTRLGRVYYRLLDLTQNS